MRGQETVDDDAAAKSKKRDREEAAGAGGQRKAAGLQQIEGVVQNLSELRRRSRKAATKGPTWSSSSSPAPAAAEESLLHKNPEAEGALRTCASGSASLQLLAEPTFLESKCMEV